MNVKFGTSIPLYAILEDDDATKIVRCTITNPRSLEVIASDVILAPVPGQPGDYADDSVIMPEVSNLIAKFVIMEADDVTFYAKGSEDISLIEAASGGSGARQSFADIVGILDDNELTATVKVKE